MGGPVPSRVGWVPQQVQLQGIHPLLLPLVLLRALPHSIHLPQIIISTGISYGVNLNAKFGVSVVGNIPSG